MTDDEKASVAAALFADREAIATLRGLPTMQLKSWNERRRALYLQEEPIPTQPGWFRYKSVDLPTPTPEEMPRCECGASLVDTEPGWMLTSGVPQAWCHCIVCGKRGQLRVW